ncbi:MAG: hypothetical protein IKK42_00905 [Oscillospiraceae bacterium]|nr:hypothetical protein [Oscillospiraceae bacterium]
MHKMIRVNEKRLAAKYNRRIFLFSLPSLSVLISLLIIVLIFIVRLDSDMPLQMYRTIIYVAYGAVAYGFAVCLIGSILEDILIRAHREHTYIQIADSIMIVSQHCRTVFQDWKWVHYKKMWVVRLSEVENAECIKNHISLIAPARYFNENSEWLNYSGTDEGIAFERWWYNANGGKDVTSIEITDFYTHGERIVRHILHCANKVRDREQRRAKFRKEMLEIAKNVNYPHKLKDRYQPPDKRKKR